MPVDRLSQLDTLLDEALVEIAAEDFDGAENTLLRMEVILSLVPDVQSGTQETKYRNGISTVRKAIEKHKSAAAAIQVSTVEYKRPS